MAKILLVRKMSALEYHHKFNHPSEELHNGHKENGNSIKKIEEILRDHGCEFNTVTRDELKGINFSDYTYVVSAGGDGTVIAVAAYNLATPQINLKTEQRSRGELCCNDLEKSLDLMLNGRFEIEEWTRQDVYRDGKLITKALNETCVGESGLDFSCMAKYNFSIFDFSGKQTDDYLENSGLVMATGTGSTGWGSTFEHYKRSSKTFKFRTVLPNIGTLNEGEFSSCRVVYKNHVGNFKVDTVKYDLPRDSVLEIKPSKFPLLVVRPNELFQ